MGWGLLPHPFLVSIGGLIMLINSKFAGRDVVTPFGKVKFNDRGEADGLTTEQEKEFKGIPGYVIVQNTEPEVEVKENSKEEQKETKSSLNNITVKDIEALAKEKGIELEGTTKKEKVESFLDAQ